MIYRNYLNRCRHILQMTDTKPIIVSTKTCSKCSNTKDVTLFIKERNICKPCDNNRKKLQYHNSGETAGDKICTQCSVSKDISEFIKNRNICKVCNNDRRKQRYQTDETHRAQQVKLATKFKTNKRIERQDIEKLHQEIIGIDNKNCRYCCEIKPKTRFRCNRLKCVDCERDDPTEKFKRYVRTRIYNCLLKRKDRGSIEYLGCSLDDYMQWIMTYNENYNIDNHGKLWHIDHVIPLSKFNLDNPDEQLFAFNWMNTMPLSCRENLQKGNKIISSQVLEHLEKIKKYHIDNNLKVPNEYIDLYATFLVVREVPKDITTTL